MGQLRTANKRAKRALLGQQPIKAAAKAETPAAPAKPKARS